MTRVAHPISTEVVVDGGYSGRVTVTLGRANPGVSPSALIFVDAPLVDARLYLAEVEAHEFGMALVRAADVLRRERMEVRQ